MNGGVKHNIYSVSFSSSEWACKLSRALDSTATISVVCDDRYLLVLKCEQALGDQSI